MFLSWLLLVVTGCFWLLLFASGCFWMFLVVSGCFWLLWLFSRCFWLFLCSWRKRAAEVVQRWLDRIVSNWWRSNDTPLVWVQVTVAWLLHHGGAHGLELGEVRVKVLLVVILLLRRRHQEVGGGWRHRKTRRSRWNGLAAAQEWHDVAAEALVVVRHVQLVAAAAVVALVPATWQIVHVVFLKIEMKNENEMKFAYVLAIFWVPDCSQRCLAL
jgi:hypothetical protein